MSREHAYAYEAGYRDGSINYELEHCPACKNVADLQEALAENAKLREQVASFIELSQDMVIYAGQNMARHFAKRLRKLGVPL